MPVAGADINERKPFSYLEALGRTICGISPWLESSGGSEQEQRQRSKYAELAREAIANAVTPGKKDFMLFETGTQPLVDTAFLVEGIMRAPNELWQKLDDATKNNLILSVKETRKIKPWRTNWVLFSAMVESFLLIVSGGKDGIKSVIDMALALMECWYVGDGCYADGQWWHFDYYNGIVIHPLLMDIIKQTPWLNDATRTQYIRRSQRYAEILERMIAPDGTWPIIGRSITYRMGIFHALAVMALNKQLGKYLSDAQVRCGLTAVIRRAMSSNIFTNDGWLKIGIVGEQPGLGENYINTGSLYMCTVVFLPLGLPAEDPFWTSPDQPYTAQKIWTGEDVTADKAI